MARKTKVNEEERELLKTAKKRLKKAVEADNHNRQAALEDLRFLQGDQWEPSEKQQRKLRGRPCLQINVLPKYSKQVCGEMRRNKVRIKVRPFDNRADLQVAKIREGLIYNIEYVSNAEAIYDHAGKMVVDCGYGAWRVMTRYTESQDDDPFLQEIYLESVWNPFTIFMDPDAKDANYADAKWAFVVTRMSRDDFEAEYGKENFPTEGLDFGDNPDVGLRDELYWDKENVTVAEYFFTEYKEVEMCQMSDGQVMKKAEAEAFIANAKETLYQSISNDPAGGNLIGEIPSVIKTRTVKEPSLKWKKLTATKVLEERDWPGRYIPIVLVHGEVSNIEGRRYIKGLIRDAKDPQRMLNYWHTSACETVALAPKAPWLATAKMIEGYETDYQNANEDNLPVMLYNIDSDAPGERPSRLEPGQAPAAVFSEIARAEQSIKDTLGLYNADVGDTSNERFRDISGKAIAARQAPGDTATFVYPDNMNRAIAHGGKIINDLIPHIYDTPREIRVRSVDDSESFVPVNTTVGGALESVKGNPQRFEGMDLAKLQKAASNLADQGPNAKFNDIREGKYDIVITTGPTFATQRAEAVENMVKIAMASRMSPLDKYFILHNSDFPGADEYAEAVKTMVPTHILPPKEGERPRPQPPVPPEAQVALAKVQLDMARQRTEQIRLQVQLAKLYRETTESETGARKQLLNMMEEINAPVGTHPVDAVPDKMLTLGDLLGSQGGGGQKGG